MLFQIFHKSGQNQLVGKLEKVIETLELVPTSLMRIAH